MLDGRFSRVTSYADMRQATGEITGGNVSGWISMSDKWPEDRQWVLIYCDPREHFAGRFHVCRFKPFIYAPGEKPVPEFSMPGFGGITATHWMPLPEPPVVSNTDFNLTQPAASQVKS